MGIASSNDALSTASRARDTPDSTRRAFVAVRCHCSANRVQVKTARLTKYNNPLTDPDRDPATSTGVGGLEEEAQGSMSNTVIKIAIWGLLHLISLTS